MDLKKEGVYLSKCGVVLAVLVADEVVLIEHTSCDLKMSQRLIVGVAGKYNTETDKFDDYSLIFERHDEDDFIYMGEL